MTAAARLFRLNVEVADLAAAADFYSALFDTELRPQMGSRCYLVAGEVTLQIVEVAAPQPLPKALYFEVDDLDAFHRRASGLGAAAPRDVHGMRAGAPGVRPWGERSFYADDPWDNPLCFVEAGTRYAG